MPLERRGCNEVFKKALVKPQINENDVENMIEI